jgi:hypothetical protein
MPAVRAGEERAVFVDVFGVALGAIGDVGHDLCEVAESSCFRFLFEGF